MATLWAEYSSCQADQMWFKFVINCHLKLSVLQLGIEAQQEKVRQLVAAKGGELIAEFTEVDEDNGKSWSV